jgi:hypothetical protein
LPITITIDDEYATMGDPFKLLKFATCNRCADYFVTRNRLRDAIARVCGVLTLVRGAGHEQEKESRMVCKISDKLEQLTKDYAQAVSTYYRTQTLWDIEFVNMLMDRPEMVNSVLDHYRMGYASGELKA